MEKHCFNLTYATFLDKKTSSELLEKMCSTGLIKLRLPKL